jgi:pseudomonalisin
MREYFRKWNREERMRSKFFRKLLWYRSDICVDCHVTFHDNRHRSTFPCSGGYFPVTTYLESLEDVMLPAIPNRNAVPRRSVAVFSALSLLLLVLAVTLGHAQTGDLVRIPLNPANRISLSGHHPSWASRQNDVGAVPADLLLERLTLILARSPEREQMYTKFLQDQQSPASPDYHHWLTPVEIGKRFGVSAHDIHAVTVWLQSQNLHVDSVSNSRERIIFSGPASAIGNAFGAEMHYFMVSGEKRISITAEPQIPAALGQVVKSISGLYTVKYYPQNKSETAQPSHHVASDSGGIQPEGSGYTCGGVPCNVVFPADFATIYNINGVGGGINGSGQTIAIIGRSGVCNTDIANFASAAAVTQNPLTVIVPLGGITPPAAVCTGNASGDQGEATLDVTRSGSVAQGAALDLVVSADSGTVNGIAVAATFVVDTPPNPAPKIMSISFGGCESLGGQGDVTFWDDLFQEAALGGISVFVSSGDSGAAGCDTAFTTPPPTQILSPNAICSSSHVTCVGGTEFADSANPSQYWNPSNGPGFESAIGYIPEGAWNEPMNGSQFQVAGTGGGVSAFISTPSYQTGTGVPSARAGRYTPDVAFTASIHDGYFACVAANNQCTGNGPFSLFAGTSAAAPDMAGIAALLNQKEGSAQGPLNPTLYQLAATPANNVFNDVTVGSSGVTGCVVTTPSICNNSTAGPNSLTGGLSGYLVGTGFDEATGLGSINVANLLTNWNSSVTTTTTALAIAPPSPVNAGTSVTLTATVTPSSGSSTPTGAVTFNDAVLGKLGTGTLNSLGNATFTSTTLAGASYSITATYSPTGAFGGSASSAVPYSVQDFTIAANPTTATVTAPGQSGTTTLTITPLGGFNAAITYTCSGLPSEATCAFATASATSETVTFATTAPSSRLDKSPLGRSRTLFYALLLPGILGLAVSAGNRKRSLRGARLLGLIAILALSTLWMPACGGGSSTTTPSNPGTPAGSTPVTVTATAGSLVHTLQVTLTVQ